MSSPSIELTDDFQGQLGPMWELDRMPPDGFRFVRDPVSPDRLVLAITVHPGDCPGPGSHGEQTERAELHETKAVALPTGTDAWYGFSLYLPADFPVVDRRLVIGQWYQPHPPPLRSPLVANRFRDGVFSITRQDGLDRVVCAEEARELRGRWIDLLYHLRFSATEGRLAAWANEVPVVAYEGPLGYPDGRDRVQFRIGLYRDHLPMPMTMLMRRFRRGGSFADVHPDHEP